MYQENSNRGVGMMIITETETGKKWECPNYPHDWEKLVLYLQSKSMCMNLIYCDMEGIAKIGNTYYLLDECGNWDFLPDGYEVKE